MKKIIRMAQYTFLKFVKPAPAILIIALLVTAVAYAAAGDLDTSGFGSPNGYVTTDIGSGDDRGNDLVLQPDGKIVVVGWSDNGSNFDFAIVRYNSGGSLDTTGFGSPNGYVTTDISNGDDEVYDAAIQLNGKIIVVGRSHNGSNFDLAVARYNSNGSLDTAGFGSPNGYVTTAIGSGDDQGFAVAIQPDGKILVAGATWNSGTSHDIILARFNSDGSLDTTGFGIPNGYMITDIGGVHDYGRDVTIQADSKIVVAGQCRSGFYNDFVAARYNSDGNLDTTGFGNPNGYVTTDISGVNDYGYSIVLQPDNKLVVSGYSNGDFAVVRYNSNGSLDTSGFGSGNGYVTTSIGSTSYSFATALQSDGKVVAAGYSTNGSQQVFAVARYESDGDLDTSTFGAPNGFVTTAIGSSDDVGWATAIQPDGKIVVAGESDNGTDWDFAVARYNNEDPNVVNLQSISARSTSNRTVAILITLLGLSMIGLYLVNRTHLAEQPPDRRTPI